MLVAWSGWALLHGGVFAYHNYYGRDVYSAEVVVFGVVVMVLADLQLAPGDSLGLKTTGAWTTSEGSLTFSLDVL